MLCGFRDLPEFHAGIYVQDDHFPLILGDAVEGLNEEFRFLAADGLGVGCAFGRGSEQGGIVKRLQGRVAAVAPGEADGLVAYGPEYVGLGTVRRGFAARDAEDRVVDAVFREFGVVCDGVGVGEQGAAVGLLELPNRRVLPCQLRHLWSSASPMLIH